MAVDVDAVMEKAQAGQVEPYYGFDPDAEYVIRARNRDYKGRTLRFYEFLNGQSIAGAMRQDATEEQKWNRAERLAWFQTAPGYVIYRRGEEPERSREPLWAHLEPEEITAAGEDTGEMRYPQAAPRKPAGGLLSDAQPPRMDAQNRPVTHYPVADGGDSGEHTPTPEITRIGPGSRVPQDVPEASTSSDTDGSEAGPSFQFPQA